MCSITKQFTCALVLDAFPDPRVLDADVRARLPRLERRGARRAAPVPQPVRPARLLGGGDAARRAGRGAVRRCARRRGDRRHGRTLQFAPGTRYSYCNQNFRILSDILQEPHRPRASPSCCARRIFEPAGMETALPGRRHPRHAGRHRGLRGQPRPAGFRAAENRILWTGDAGLGRQPGRHDRLGAPHRRDARRRRPRSIAGSPRRSPSPTARRPPTASAWAARTECGRAVIGHGGALRGWRSHRLYVAAERVSVVVMFNHLADAHAAAIDAARRGAGRDAADARPRRCRRPTGSAPISSRRPGCRRASMPAGAGQVRLRFGQAAGTARPAARRQRRGRTGRGCGPAPDGLWMDRPRENQQLAPAALPAARAVARRRRPLPLRRTGCRADRGRMPAASLYGGFSGFLGHGRMELLEPVGARRLGPALPARARPYAAGRLDAGVPPRRLRVASTEVEVGCWLARGLRLRDVGLSLSLTQDRGGSPILISSRSSSIVSDRLGFMFDDVDGSI